MTILENVVSSIIRKCKHKALAVTEPLAAFVARTLVEEDAETFCMENILSEDEISILVDRSVQYLEQQDCPPLETIKMQLNFDLDYVQHEERLAKKKYMYEKRIKHFHRSITSLQPAGTGDIQTLTVLYKQIFTLLLVHQNAEESMDRNVEREVAAALESIFPRIGLKSFVSLSENEKMDQLRELADIVYGIRLLNREIGKGGSGIAITTEDIHSKMLHLREVIEDNLQVTSELCNNYTEVLMFGHHTKPADLEEDTIRRWQQELINRRQYLSCLQSLSEDTQLSYQNIEGHLDAFDNKIKELKSAIGSRNSVPKEMVYPMFESLSKIWASLESEHDLVIARTALFEHVLEFRASCALTLATTSEWIQKAKSIGTPLPDELFEEVPSLTFEGKAYVPSKRRSLAVAEASNDHPATNDTASESKEAPKEEETPVRLSVESTPEFLQLPLEYQGFCPWTIVHRDGLLLPGDPSIGVLRYQNTFNVFVNERALQEFMLHPGEYVEKVLNQAIKSPALIHLLRLQDSFPEASLASLVSADETSILHNQRHALLAPTDIKMVDASTETPVHFIEKNIDFNYEWNEWSLRRRAIKLANIRKCKTVSSQTGLSTFRKEIQTQIYLPVQQGTQTGISRGTNPRKQVTYLAGLRGNPKHGSSKYTHQDDQKQPAIISYQYDR